MRWKATCSILGLIIEFWDRLFLFAIDTRICSARLSWRLIEVQRCAPFLYDSRTTLLTSLSTAKEELDETWGSESEHMGVREEASHYPS